MAASAIRSPCRQWEVEKRGGGHADSFEEPDPEVACVISAHIPLVNTLLPGDS